MLMRLAFRTLDDCHDPALAGGKAVGLARLLLAGFDVPWGICITAEAYQAACRQVGLDPRQDWKMASELPAPGRVAALAAARDRLAHFSWPTEWSADLEQAIAKIQPGGLCTWAVRSSATNEDTADTSGAGLYRTELGVKREDIVEAVQRCWESVWDTRVIDYYRKEGRAGGAPAMAVIIQPIVAARAAGVVFSRHPISGRSDEVLINAVLGLAEPLASGLMAPDEYVVGLGYSDAGAKVVQRRVCPKRFMMKPARQGTILETVASEEGSRSSLTDEEAVRLGLLASKVEQMWGVPIDMEWAFDEERLWVLQARPIAGRDAVDRLTDQQCDWSRANFKETLPELPSPLSLSFLTEFMENFILSHYRELGCTIPDSISAVRVVEGRPFINVTVLQSCAAQLGGQPERVTEHMGGEEWMPVLPPARLSAWKLARAGVLVQGRIRRSFRRAPAWFEELKRTLDSVEEDRISILSPEEVGRRLECLGHFLREGECTFAIVAAVSQAEHVLSLFLPRWLGAEWRSLLNRAMQGRDTIISAKQIHWLRRIGEQARQDAQAIGFFLSKPWEAGLYRKRLAGTACLAELDAFLSEYGHRGIGESDSMSPRFSEDPTYLLDIVRQHVIEPPPETAEQAAQRQKEDRATALRVIRRRCGLRYDRWLMFRWWYARLCRACELREANRHYLMYYGTAIRRLLLALGRQLTAAGRVTAPDDVFFTTWDELKQLACESPAQDWKGLVAERRAARLKYAAVAVPDFIPAWRSRSIRKRLPKDNGRILSGISISTGIVEGRVAVVRSMEDVDKVRPGDIIVTPVIDPGMAALFGLAGGLIADMGGTLSHGAIIAREYGIPGIVNVAHATRLLEDGERVTVNATDGLVHRLPS
jgi:pyruvate,water dikinase